MRRETVRKWKWFWAWQDEKQEAWLEEMSRQGLHLQRLGRFGNYWFSGGQPIDYAYRMDFNIKKKSDDYFLFIQAAGWEHLGSLAGWQYWRKHRIAGETNEFYTDAESKIQKYQRLMTSLVAATPSMSVMMMMGMAMFKRFPGRHPSWFVVLFMLVFTFAIVFAALNAVMVKLRIKALEQDKVI